MAMAGLGRPAEIWRWPFHYYLAVRAEYLRIINPPKAESDEKREITRIHPNVTVETIQR